MLIFKKLCHTGYGKKIEGYNPITDRLPGIKQCTIRWPNEPEKTLPNLFSTFLTFALL